MRKIRIPIGKNLYSLVNYGNTSGATIPLALDLGIRDGKVKNGDRVLMYGFGSGLVHAGQLLELNLDEQINTPNTELVRKEYHLIKPLKGVRI